MKLLLLTLVLSLTSHSMEYSKKIQYKITTASYYSNALHGKRTASGERYNKTLLTAAHRSLPFGTLVRVTMLSTGKQVIVKINDRGPFVKRRSIDLSYKAAKKIGMLRAGISKVKLEVISLG